MNTEKHSRNVEEKRNTFIIATISVAVVVNFIGSVLRSPSNPTFFHIGAIVALTVGALGLSAVLAFPTYYPMKRVTRKLDYYDYVGIWTVIISIYFNLVNI